MNTNLLETKMPPVSAFPTMINGPVEFKNKVLGKGHCNSTKSF